MSNPTPSDWNDPKADVGEAHTHVAYTRLDGWYIRAPLKGPPTQDVRVPQHWSEETLVRHMRALDREYEARRKMKTAGPIAIGDIVDVFFGDGAPLMHSDAEVISEPGVTVHLRLEDNTVRCVSGSYQLLRKPRGTKT